MQSVSHLLMIKPSHFGFNVETAANNYFQQNIPGNHQQKALKEFEAFVTLMQINITEYQRGTPVIMAFRKKLWVVTI